MRFYFENNVLFFGTSFSWDEYHVRLIRSNNNSVYPRICFDLSFMLVFEYFKEIEIDSENTRKEKERGRGCREQVTIRKDNLL